MTVRMSLTLDWIKPVQVNCFVWSFTLIKRLLHHNLHHEWNPIFDQFDGKNNS
jgi:hypothetical protein